MEKSKVSDGLDCLERRGWSDLVDQRWESYIISDLKKDIPDITDEEIQKVLDIIIW